MPAAALEEMSVSVHSVRRVLASALPRGEAQIEEHVGARWTWLSAAMFDNETAESWPTAYANLDKLRNSTACSRDGLCDVVSPATTFERWDSLGPILQCPNGLLTDVGMKRLCASSRLLNATQQDACTVVSLGSANEYSFETAVHKRFPWCKIHTVDCTVAPHVPAHLRSALTFHQVCLDEEDSVRDWPTHGVDANTNRTKTFLSWASLARRLSLAPGVPPVLLKMDIEGYEWSVLPSILRSDAPLPLEIALEMHAKGKGTLPWRWRLKSPFEIGSFMDFMFTRGGYALVDVDLKLARRTKKWVAVDVTLQQIVRPAWSRHHHHHMRQR